MFDLGSCDVHGTEVDPLQWFSDGVLMAVHVGISHPVRHEIFGFLPVSIEDVRRSSTPSIRCLQARPMVSWSLRRISSGISTRISRTSRTSRSRRISCARSFASAIISSREHAFSATFSLSLVISSRLVGLHIAFGYGLGGHWVYDWCLGGPQSRNDGFA